MDSTPLESWRQRSTTLLRYFQHHAEAQGGLWLTNEFIVRQFLVLLETPDPSEADLQVMQTMLGRSDLHDGTAWYEFKSMAANWLDQCWQRRYPSSREASANGYYPTTSEVFRARVREWLVASSEVLVAALYHASPGDKQFRLLTTFDEFEKFVEILHPRTGVIVFKHHELTNRGRADDHLIAHAFESIPDSTAWLAVPLEPTLIAGDIQLFQHAHGAAKDTLRTQLLGYQGKHFAVGRYPDNWQSRDATIAAVVPDAKGHALLGIY